MYRFFIRPILFLFPPEFIHNVITNKLRILAVIPGVKGILRSLYAARNSKPVEVAGLKFPNRVGLAAGFDKNAKYFRELACFGFGHIEIGTLTPRAQPGNPKPRSFRLIRDKALINRMGFNNEGVKAAVRRLKKRGSKGLVLGGNIGKNTATSNREAIYDYEKAFDLLYDHVDYLVINVSCPNTGDLTDLQDKTLLERILTRLMEIKSAKSPKKPVFLKISPDLSDKRVMETVELTMKCSLDGIVATNTTAERLNLSTPEEKLERIGYGGLSGTPIRNRSTEVIRIIHNYTQGRLPIIGVGGIMGAEDALEKLEAGASLVQVYTGFVYTGPSLVKKILKALD